MVEKATDSRVEKAARNNAVWCDTVCCAHGIPGEFHDALWFNHYPAPRFHPNVVTLTQAGTAAQMAQIQTLVATNLLGSWGVKDSFNSLDLATLGFQPAFEATWLWRDPSQPLPPQSGSAPRWKVIQTESELSLWEKSWSDDSSQPRIFLPPLLADPNILFIAGYQDESLIAGAIVNRTDDVIGLSNVFAPPESPLPFWTGCIAVAQERFPDLSIVGYERGPELAIAQEIGFETMQALKVWTR